MPATPSEAATVRSRDTPLPGARLALVLLLLINLFNYIDRKVLAAVVSPIKQTFFGEGAAPAAGRRAGGRHRLVSSTASASSRRTRSSASLGTAFMVMYMIGAPVFGRLAERHSRWVLVGIGVILWSLASGASGLAATFLILLLTRCFVGIGEAAYGPVAPTIISDFYPVQIRGQVLAWFYMAIPVGSALGYVIGGWVANSNIGEWGAGLIGVQARELALGLLRRGRPGNAPGPPSFFMREPPRGQADGAARRQARTSGWRDYRILLRTPSYVLCTLGMTAMTFAMGGIAFWMPYYLEGRGASPTSATITFGAITATAGLTGTLLGGIVGDRLRNRFPGSYFLVSGTAMLVGLPGLRSPCCARRSRGSGC